MIDRRSSSRVLPAGHVLNAASVAQSCTLSASVQIVAGRANLSSSSSSLFSSSEMGQSRARTRRRTMTIWLRLCRAALYRRVLLCHTLGNAGAWHRSDALPNTTRRPAGRPAGTADWKPALRSCPRGTL